MITIENLTNRIQVFNLTNEVAPLRRVYPTRTVDKDGKVSRGERRVVHPDSLTILSGSSVVVPDSYQSVPEIRKALAAKRIRIADAPEAPAEPEADAEAPDAGEAAPAGPRPRRARG